MAFHLEQRTNDLEAVPNVLQCFRFRIGTMGLLGEVIDHAPAV